MKEGRVGEIGREEGRWGGRDRGREKEEKEVGKGSEEEKKRGR